MLEIRDGLAMITGSAGGIGEELLAEKIRCVASAPGYVAATHGQGMNQKVLEKIVGEVPIGHLIKPSEVASAHRANYTVTRPLPGIPSTSMEACAWAPGVSSGEGPMWALRRTRLYP